MVATAQRQASVVYASVPRLFPGETIVCLGTGPSLCAEDVEACRGRARVIAIKDAIQLAPWADVLYAAGADGSRWYQIHGDALTFAGLRYTLDPAAQPWAEVLRHTGFTGLELDPSGLRTGKNSGYQAINLAVHLGAARIVLLGFDLKPNAKGLDHFFGPRVTKPPYADCLPLFETLVDPLRAAGVSIVNASRVTKITCFDRASIAEALA